MSYVSRQCKSNFEIYFGSPIRALHLTGHIIDAKRLLYKHYQLHEIHTTNLIERKCTKSFLLICRKWIFICRDERKSITNRLSGMSTHFVITFNRENTFETRLNETNWIEINRFSLSYFIQNNNNNNNNNNKQKDGEIHESESTLQTSIKWRKTRL